MVEDVEKIALSLRRRAFEVLEGRESLTAFLETLWQLDSNTPELLEQVASQLELDNGRWSAASALPEITVKRDKEGRIGLISFNSPDAAREAHNERIKNPIVWCSHRKEFNV